MQDLSLSLAFCKQHDTKIFLIISSIFQLLDLSGILTVFFCGIVMSHYTWHNVTESSRVTTKYVFCGGQLYLKTWWFLLYKEHYVYYLANLPFPCCRHTFATLSFIAEIFLFLYVGMDALDIEKWKLASSRYLLLLIFNDDVLINSSSHRYRVLSFSTMTFFLPN